jgi:hypothetical protein
MKSHLSILSLSCWASGVVLRKSLPIPISSRVFLAPSCLTHTFNDILNQVSFYSIAFFYTAIEYNCCGFQRLLYFSNTLLRCCIFSVVSTMLGPLFCFVFFIHLFICAYIVWAISLPSPPPLLSPPTPLTCR